MSTSSSLQLRLIKARKEHSSTASKMDHLLEQCPGNARVVVNAEAGIGKVQFFAILLAFGWKGPLNIRRMF